jgi:hypothetical protein
MATSRPLDVLLVEDNEADIQLTIAALRDAKIPTNIHAGARIGRRPIPVCTREWVVAQFESEANVRRGMQNAGFRNPSVQDGSQGGAASGS